MFCTPLAIPQIYGLLVIQCIVKSNHRAVLCVLTVTNKDLHKCLKSTSFKFKTGNSSKLCSLFPLAFSFHLRSTEVQWKVLLKVMLSPPLRVTPTSLKMGVTKADKHCDLGCLFTESPDWRGKRVLENQPTHKMWLCACVCFYLWICVCVALL